MNTLSWMLLLASSLSNLQVILFIVVGVSCFTLAVITLLTAIHNDVEFDKKPYPKLRYFVCVAVLAMCASLIPSERTMYFMMASESAGRIAQTKEAQDIGSKILDRLNTYLSEKDHN